MSAIKVYPRPKSSFRKKTTTETKKKGKLLFKNRKSRKVHSLLAYSYMPMGVDFETKEPEEKIILLLRRHPITNVKWMVIAGLMMFAPTVLIVFPIIDFLSVEFRIVSILGWYLVTSAYIIESFLGWFFNVNIITDERIIDIDFHNLIYKEVSDANIDQIQDVTYKMGGAIRTVFNYGEILVQTAAETPNFEFSAVPKPDKVAKILQELRIEEQEEKLEGRVR